MVVVVRVIILIIIASFVVRVLLLLLVVVVAFLMENVAPSSHRTQLSTILFPRISENYFPGAWKLGIAFPDRIP
jgi:hypothetical protein